MKARSCKIWFRQSYCPPHWLCMCLIFITQNEHIIFMTTYCNAWRWWETVTSKPNVMVIHIKFFTYLSIFQNTNLQSLYIDTSLCPKSMPQNKGVILVKVYQDDMNTCPILYSNSVTMPTWSTNIRYPKILLTLYKIWYVFNNILQILHGYWLARLRLLIR